MRARSCMMFGRLVVAGIFSGICGWQLFGGEAPLDGEAYYRVRCEARQLYREHNHATAIPLYERLTSSFAHDGQNWLELAACQTAEKQFQPAIASYQQAMRYGASEPDINSRHIAGLYAQLRQYEPAYHWLDCALASGMAERILLRRDDQFARMRDEDRFRTLAAEPLDAGTSRGERWRRDLDFLVAEAERLHPGQHSELGRGAGAKELAAAVERLKPQIADLTDAQMLIELHRVLTLLGDGHSRTSLFHRQIRLTRLPLTLYRFADGVCVVNTSPEHERWIGARVVKIADTPIDQAVDSVTPIISRDNEMGIRVWAPIYLTVPAVLERCGIVGKTDRVALTLQRDGSSQETAVLEAVALRPSNDSGRSALQRDNDNPLWLRDTETNYWLEHLPDDHAIFVQFNGVGEARGESIEEFSRRLQQACTDADVKRLIVDVRHNGGGNTFLYQPLLRTLIHFERDKPGRRLFLLTSRHTFSACQNFCTDVDRLTDAVFAGEPTGSNPNFIGESTTVVLPHTELQVSISTRAWQFSYPMDRRVWIAPDVPVALTSADYLAGRDPVLEAVRRVIAAE